MPQRLQRKRTRGWRLPEGGICITRPGPWGNPFPVVPEAPLWARRAAIRKGHCRTVEESLMKFREYAEERLQREPDWLEPLRNRDLYCFCPEGSPCHGDLLIELANRPLPITPKE